MNKLFWMLLFVIVLSGAVLVPSVYGQPVGCDEGVIRLPDRSGTIQICSALAAKVPELTRQLREMTEGYESQQEQIAELTRLVRGLNNIGRGLDLNRQGQMLESLSLEFSRLQNEDASATRGALEALVSRLDELQSKMLAAMGDGVNVSALSEAMKGALGDAIADLDLVEANQQLSDISDRLQAVQADVSQIRANTEAVRSGLSDLSLQIRELARQGGLVLGPQSYSEYYHNARILAQRGEVDLALESYLMVLAEPLQLADPIIDFTTLLARRYGRTGASKYLDGNMKTKMTPTAYAYAQQLLESSQLEAVWQMILTDPESVLSFPPLVALYVRKIEGKEQLSQNSFAWKDWVTLYVMIENIQEVIESGEYFSYFADQIRGGTDIEEFEKAAWHFTSDDFLIRLLPNFSGEEFQFTRRSVDIRTSPIGLDFTYYFEEPGSDIDIGGSWFDVPMGSEYMDKPFVRGDERFDILIWDAAIDVEQPLEICVISDGTERCLDFSVPDRICKVSRNVEGRNCLRKYPDWGTYAADARVHISPSEVFGEKCLSRIRYTDFLGRLIDINAKGLIATFRGSGSDELLDVMNECGYSIQIDRQVSVSQYF